MKKTLLFSALAFLAMPAFAQTDLSRPGALDRLKSEHPKHFEPLPEIARVGQTLNCSDDEVERLKKEHSLAKLECGFVNNSTNPPSRRVRFEIDGASYVMTVRLTDTAPKIIGREVPIGSR